MEEEAAVPGTTIGVTIIISLAVFLIASTTAFFSLGVFVFFANRTILMYILLWVLEYHEKIQFNPIDFLINKISKYFGKNVWDAISFPIFFAKG